MFLGPFASSMKISYQGFIILIIVKHFFSFVHYKLYNIMKFCIHFFDSDYKAYPRKAVHHPELDVVDEDDDWSKDELNFYDPKEANRDKFIFG